MPRSSKVHYIAPSAISIVPNANGSQRDLSVFVAKGAKIKVHCNAIAALKPDPDTNTYREWNLSGRNRRLDDAAGAKEYTIYARLPINDTAKGYLVFAPKEVRPEGLQDKYCYVTTSGVSPQYSSGSGGASVRDYQNWWIRLGDVSLPENGQRTVTLDTGILGTDQYNEEWNFEPDNMPLRVELGCTIDDEDAGPTPYVPWDKRVTLCARLVEGWEQDADSRVARWTITRNTGNAAADAAWPGQARAAAFAASGSMEMLHQHGSGDDFCEVPATVFTITAWGTGSSDSSSSDSSSSDSSSSDSSDGLTVLASESITILAETKEVYELELSAGSVTFDPYTQAYSPAEGVAISIRAKAQDGTVIHLSQTQIATASLRAFWLEVESADSSDSGSDSSDSSSGDAANELTFADGMAVLPVQAFAAGKSINVWLENAAGVHLDERSVAYVRDGASDPTLTCTPASLTIPCTTAGSVKENISQVVALNFSMKVGNNAATVTAISVGAKSIYVVVEPVANTPGSFTVSISAGVPKTELDKGITFAVTGTCDGKTYTKDFFFALIASCQGEDGEDGEDGKDAVVYDLVVSPAAVNFRSNAVGSFDGNSDKTITCSVTKTTGDSTSVIAASGGTYEGHTLKSRLLYATGNPGEWGSSATVTIGWTHAVNSNVTGVEFALSKTADMSEIIRRAVANVTCDGRRGEAGAVGKMFFPMGEYQNQEYKIENDLIPLVFVPTPGVYNDVTEAEGDYWYLYADTNNIGTAQNPEYAAPAETEGNPWRKANEYGLVITQGIFAKFAKLGKGIFSGDYLFSMNGRIGDTEYSDGAEYTDTSVSPSVTKPAYTWFKGDPDVQTGTFFVPNWWVDLKTGKMSAARGNFVVTGDGDVMVNGTIRAKNLFHGLCLFREGGTYSNNRYYFKKPTGGDETYDPFADGHYYTPQEIAEKSEGHLSEDSLGFTPCTYDSDLVMCFPNQSNWTDTTPVFLPHPKDFEGKLVEISGFGYGLEKKHFNVGCVAENRMAVNAHVGNNGHVVFDDQTSGPMQIGTGGTVKFISVKSTQTYANPDEAYCWVLIVGSEGGDVIIDGDVISSGVSSVCGHTGAVGTSDIMTALLEAGFLDDAVLTTPQTLTAAKKDNARTNVMGKDATSGKAHVYLPYRANGSLTQSDLNSTNTVYHVLYDYSLGTVEDVTVTIPANDSNLETPQYITAATKLASLQAELQELIDDGAEQSKKDAKLAEIHAQELVVNRTQHYYYYTTYTLPAHKRLATRGTDADSCVFLNSQLNAIDGRLEAYGNYDSEESKTVYIANLNAGSYAFIRDSFVRVPDGCTLDFEGGSIGNGTVSNNATIVGVNHGSNVRMAVKENKDAVPVPRFASGDIIEGNLKDLRSFKLNDGEAAYKAGSNNLVQNFRIDGRLGRTTPGAADYVGRDSENRYGIGVSTRTGDSVYTQQNVFQNLQISYFDIAFLFWRNGYSNIRDLWLYDNNIGIDLNTDGTWMGAIDISNCHLSRHKVGLRITPNIAAASNETIHMRKCTFEGALVALDVWGDLIVRDCYFGDQGRYSYNSDGSNLRSRLTGSKLAVVHPGAKIIFEDCVLNFGGTWRSRYNTTAGAFGDYLFDFMFEMLGTDDNPCQVIMRNCRISLANMNDHDSSHDADYPTNTFLYESLSEKNLLVFDNCRLYYSDKNNQHGWSFERMYTGNFLHEGVPVTDDNDNPIANKTCIIQTSSKHINYMVNGYFDDALQNTLNQECKNYQGAGIIVPLNDTNIYGGQVTSIRRWSAPLYYSIPTEFVGKEMTLVVGVKDWYKLNTPRIDINASDYRMPDDYTGDTNYIYFSFPSPGTVNHFTFLKRIVPTKQFGRLTFAMTSESDGYVNLSFVKLVETRYERYIDKAASVADVPLIVYGDGSELGSMDDGCRVFVNKVTAPATAEGSVRTVRLRKKLKAVGGVTANYMEQTMLQLPSTTYVIQHDYVIGTPETRSLTFTQENESGLMTPEKKNLNTRTTAYNTAAGEYTTAQGNTTAAETAEQQAKQDYEQYGTAKYKRIWEQKQKDLATARAKEESALAKKTKTWNKLQEATAAYTAAGSQDYYYWLAVTVEQGRVLRLSGKAIQLNDAKTSEVATERGMIFGGSNYDRTVYLGCYEGTYSFAYDTSITMPAGSTLKFDGGSISGGVLIGNNTRIIAPREAIFSNLRISGSWLVPEITSAWFSDAAQDNVLREVMALQNATILNTVVIEPGNYVVSVDADAGTALSCLSNLSLVVNGNLNLTPNAYNNYYILNCIGSHHVNISGSGQVVGDKPTHLPSGEDGEGNPVYSGEFGMGIELYGSSFVTVKDLKVKECWGDCIYIGGNGASNIIIDNCDLDNGRRNGISITNGYNIVIQNCKIQNVSGTNPQAAIDIETNENKYASNIFINNNFIDNCLLGVTIYGRSHFTKTSIAIENNYINCTWRAIAANGVSTCISIKNNELRSRFSVVEANIVGFVDPEQKIKPDDMIVFDNNMIYQDEIPTEAPFNTPTRMCAIYALKGDYMFRHNLIKSAMPVFRFASGNKFVEDNTIYCPTLFAETTVSGVVVRGNKIEGNVTIPGPDALIADNRITGYWRSTTASTDDGSVLRGNTIVHPDATDSRQVNDLTQAWEEFLKGKDEHGDQIPAENYNKVCVLTSNVSLDGNDLTDVALTIPGGKVTKNTFRFEDSFTIYGILLGLGVSEVLYNTISYGGTHEANQNVYLLRTGKSIVGNTFSVEQGSSVKFALYPTAGCLVADNSLSFPADHAAGCIISGAACPIRPIYIETGESDARPLFPSDERYYKGCRFFDQTLGLPLYWNGSYWIKGDGTRVTWPAVFTLTNIAAENMQQPDAGESYVTKLVANRGYTLPDSITVKLGNTELALGNSGYRVNLDPNSSSYGSVAVLNGSSGVTDVLTIIATALQLFTVRFALTNLTTDGTGTATESKTYEANLTADDGFDLPQSITVETYVNGVYTALEAGTDYDYTAGHISIYNVSWALRISATGTAIPRG